MSLASRVFVLFASLMILLMGSQWYTMRNVTNELSAELGKVAFSVARDTASFFILGEMHWMSAVSIDNKQSQEPFRLTPMNSPQVEIRIKNQRTDDHIKLITQSNTTEVPLPRDEIVKTVTRLEQYMITQSLVILGLGLVVTAFLANRITAPIRALTVKAKAVAQGNLGVQVATDKGMWSSEIKSSIDSFNIMSEQLLLMQQKNASLQANAHYKELGDISSGLAHSIRNPLNTLGLTVSELADFNEDEGARRKLVDSAYRQINRIDQWIKTFMTFALGAKAETETLNLVTLIEDLQFEVKQRRPDLNILTHYPEDEPKTLTLTGIKAEIHAILQAVIVNAAEVSPTNGTLDIHVSRSDTQYKIRVIDRGQGISNTIQAQLFQPHKTTKTSGSGMGLYMAQKLATNRYQGEIAILNTGSDGTEMMIRLNPARSL